MIETETLILNLSYWQKGKEADGGEEVQLAVVYIFMY
jgi:hypothetical protein